ncbi:(Fe-S)-binding protein [bacterium]|nr:(Fe-S)-binding protein [candidate division CSSED10-310 bacterium]
MAHEDLLAVWQKELMTCTLCGYCKNVCPTFLDVGWDSESARARNLLAYGLLTGEIGVDESVAAALFDCTQCGDCTRRCPSDVRTREIVQAARAVLVREHLDPAAAGIMSEGVCRTGNIFGDETVVTPSATGTAFVFIGCQFLSRPNQTKKFLKLLERIGVNPLTGEETCCGFPLAVLGYREQFAAQRERLRRLVGDRDQVITFCPTCNAFLKEEYGLPVKHITQIVAERLDGLTFKPLNVVAAYHDPCDLARGSGVVKEPRAIMRAIGVELRELPCNGEQTRCCGGGGGLLMSNPELSDRLAVSRVKQALATGAELLITSCATCEQTLKRGAQLAAGQGLGTISVRQLPDLVWKALDRQ